MPVIHDVQTRVGTARLTVEGSGPATLVLGHGAGGGIEAPDLLAVRTAGLALGLRVVRVEQPWRVAGRRIAVAPARLDEAWLDVCATLDGPLVPPGRATSRAAELLAPTVPLLVVQGSRDAFGVPPGAQVVQGADHAFAVRRKDGRTASEVTAELQVVVSRWLVAVPGVVARG